MISIYKNKFLFSVISASIISIFFYILNNRNSQNTQTIDIKDDSNSEMNLTEQSADLILKAEKKLKTDLISILTKGIGIAILIYMLMYFTEDNDDDVYNYIDVGEPKFLYLSLLLIKLKYSIITMYLLL